MKIEFYAIHRTMIEDDRIKPKPVSKVAPDWKSKLPVHVTKGNDKGKTVRACPGIDDYLHLGYVIPLWADVILTRVRMDGAGRMAPDPNGRKIHCRTAYGAPPFEFHAIEQVKGAEPFEPIVPMDQLVKPQCPWFIKTPPGWSVLVLPMYYHENQRKMPIQPLPGIINTDFWHQINTACKWEYLEPVMEIKAGTPLMHVIPFRRDDALDVEFDVIVDQPKWLELRGFQSDLTGAYRRQQKNFEKSLAQSSNSDDKSEG